MKNERNAFDELLENIIAYTIVFIFKMVVYIIKQMFFIPLWGLTKLRYSRKKDLIHIIIAIILPLTATHYTHITIQNKSIICIISLLFINSLVYRYERQLLFDSFLKCGLYTNKPPKYYHRRVQNNHMVYTIGLSIPIENVISQLNFLSQMLNYNIVDINIKSKLKFRFLEIHLSKEEATPNYLILLERAYNTLFLNVDDINNLTYEDMFTKTYIRFNSNTHYKRIVELGSEIAHRCKKEPDQVLISGDIIKDFKITIKKDLKFENDFFKLYEENKQIMKKLKIAWLCGYKEKTGLFELYDLQKFTHFLIAGASGMGKSNLLHTLLLSILLNDIDKPKKLKNEIVICDPKRNEFKDYKTIENVSYYNEFNSIIKIIEDLVVEMNARNKLIEPLEGVRDIEGYNKIHTVNPIPYKTVVIDEIADLILNPEKKIVKSFSENLSKLAQMSRSVGIRLILSTQNPTQTVLQGFIKANITTRAALGTASLNDSRTILDNHMASSIETPGKFVLQNGTENNYFYSPYIPDKKLFEILSYIKNRGVDKNHIKQGMSIESVKKDSMLDKQNDSIGCVVKNDKGVDYVVKNSSDLYTYYINLHQTNYILPPKNKIIEKLNLSGNKLRVLNNELKNQGLLEVIDNNQLKVIDLENELELKRREKENL